jgi:hypothetical protein
MDIIAIERSKNLFIVLWLAYLTETNIIKDKNNLACNSRKEIT